MTSRERVIAAFKHQCSDIVPRWCGASDEFWNKAKAELNLDDEALRVRFGDDFRRVSAPYVHHVDLPEGITYETPFGIGREGIGYGQPVNHPLGAASRKNVEEYSC